MVVYLLGFSGDSQLEMRRFFYYDFPKNKIFRIFLTKWPKGPQDYYQFWAGQESETEVLLIIPNYRGFKINLFKTWSKVAFISGAFLI